MKQYRHNLIGKTATITAKVEMDEQVVIDVIQNITYNSIRRAMQTVVNKIVGRTLPNNPKTGGKPKKANVNKLKKRIRRNFMGNGKDFLQAPANEQGTPIWSLSEGANALPVVVPKRFRGRPSKNRKVCKPDRVLSAGELLEYIKQNTHIEKSNSVAMRVANDGAQFVWAEKKTLQEVSKEFEQRAGNNIYGWASLAQSVNSNAINASLGQTGNWDSIGEAVVRPSTYRRTDTMEISAYNPSAPANTGDYQQRVIDSNIGKWIQQAYNNEMKYLSKKLTENLEMPPDVKITWE